MSLSLGIGCCLGELFYRVAKSRRQIAEINIAKCFPDLNREEQQRIVRGVLHSAGKSIVESAVALWGPARQYKKRYSITGLEHIESAQAAGVGVLLVGCHMMTLDAAARILAFHTKYDMLYRKDPNPLLAYKLIQARESFAGNAIVRSDTRQLIKNLRNAHVVWYAPDQDFGEKHSVFAPFFGVTAASVVGTARIAQLGKARVLPFAHTRDEKNHYHIEIGAPLENFPTGDDLADATRINQVIEQIIRRQPDQYLWVHRRFKTRPAGEAGFYPTRSK